MFALRVSFIANDALAWEGSLRDDQADRDRNAKHIAKGWKGLQAPRRLWGWLQCYPDGKQRPGQTMADAESLTEYCGKQSVSATHVVTQHTK